MRILLVHENGDMCAIWGRFLRRCGYDVATATSQETALALLSGDQFDVLVLEPELAGGCGLAVADLASYRNPDIRILAVTRSSVYTDRLIYELMPNARGVLRAPVRLDDLLAYLDHFDHRPLGRASGAVHGVTAGRA